MKFFLCGSSHRKLLCANCQRISIEQLELFDPYLRVTRRLTTYIHQLCKVMTVAEVACHLQLDWKTVKEIDKQYLEAQYGQPSYDRLRILAVDEISVRKGHQYLTVVLDYETGHVIYVAKERKAKTLNSFSISYRPNNENRLTLWPLTCGIHISKPLKKTAECPYRL